MRPRLREALRVIQTAQAPISRSEIADAMGISPSTAAVYCDALRLAGHIEPTGRGRFSRWLAKEEAKPIPTSAFSGGL